MTEDLTPIIEETADGSFTLFVPALKEHYHSVNGAVQEALHVFLAAGLQQCSKSCLSVFEVGFGTGLNAFLTAKYAEQMGLEIHYTSIEAFPLSAEIISKLNYSSDADIEIYRALHTAEWGREVTITPNFSLTKIEGDFTNYDFSSLGQNFDVLYFDAFAPDVQPAMWTQQVFDQMFMITKENAIMTTYCAKGEVRRRMQAAGFVVERIPGPPGKREMLRARKK